MNYVYQISDGPAVITALYEGGFSGGIVPGGIVSDIYAASPAPGAYTVQTGSAGTWLRLGTKPVYAITLDATGSFPSGASPVNVLDILRQVLIEDLRMPVAYIDAVWTAKDTLTPYAGGWYWDGSASDTGKSVVSTLLSGLGVSLVPTRTGTLRPMLLAPPASDAVPVLDITPEIITAISPVALDNSLDPPTWRWRIGWQHNFTVQTTGSGLHPQAQSDRLALIAVADRASVWADMGIKSAWRVPNDPATVTTALARQDDAQAVAQRYGALWGGRRHLWAVDIPQRLTLGVELGNVVRLQAPVPGLRQASLGIVVAEHVSSSSSSVTFQILIADGDPSTASAQNDFGADIETMTF